MLTIGTIVWGVFDVPRAIRFWCAALNYRPLREPEPDWVTLIPFPGFSGPHLTLSLVTFETQLIQRHHLDLFVDGNLAGEVERLMAFGATRVHNERPYPRGADYCFGEFVVMTDPEGNRFCVVDHGV